jgi:multidrug efflux pump subunit AcrB
MEEKTTFISRLINAFLKGNFAILLVLVSLTAGAIALFVTPREEEPQIVVPLADVLISMPGAGAEEVERTVSSRLERMLYQVDGVEYVYSISRPGMAVVTVRFFVGEDREGSLIKLYNKIFQNIDKTTPGIAGWVVKPIEIDDVPIVNATFYSDRYDTYELRRVAEEVANKLQHIPNSANITLHGGERRVLHVYLDPDRMAAYGLSTMEIAGMMKGANAQAASGRFANGNMEYQVETGPFLGGVDEVNNLMIGVYEGKPVYLRDIASIRDGPDEISTYTRIGFGPGAKDVGQGALSAVTIAVAKQKGSNAVRVAQHVEKSIEELRGDIIPDEVQVRITRNYGETANEKVNNLVESLVIAIVTVIGLVAFSMGWRTGLIVAIAVPITYSLTLLFNYLMGYTINRVTLFALILALGLLVDDPIVAVENIYRHLAMKTRSRLEAITYAMNEVMSPIVIATLAVILAFVPMFFITGMMGPYMRPMALNMPLAMLASMLVSFAITPWISNKLLPKDPGPHEHEATDVRATPTYRVYSRIVQPFVESRKKSFRLLGVMGLLLVGSVALALTGLVPLKMLPFDNKNEFQVLIDLQESAPLEKTDAVVREVETYLKTMPEVVDFTSTVGAGSPIDFNGLVRHYYLRQGPNVADIRVNLLPRKQRAMDSHSIVLRIRNDIEALAQRTGAKIKLVELPPGPPVFSTVVAEISGQPHHQYSDLIAAAETVKEQMRKETGIVEVDDTVEADQPKFFFRVDREKAGLNGIATADLVGTMQVALNGMPAGILHMPGEHNELPIVLRLPREVRSGTEPLKTIIVKGRNGQIVQAGELGSFTPTLQDKTIFHKNMERVVLVTSEMAGRGPAYAVLALQSWFNRHPLPEGIKINWAGEGEWKITVDVFRDLGIAFSIALLAIYILLVYETGSYVLPGIIMLSIPLTMIGIMPGFWLLNLFTSHPVGGFQNPVFFTATAMIGMIALAGIVVRNGIILIDFIQTALARGVPLDEAIMESGAVRFRPIFLTAGAAMLGAWPITLDPIFSGLAWSIIFGLFVSTTFTLLVIPVVYKLIYGGRGRVRSE